MIRVLVVDDHPVVRRGLRQILAEEPDMEVSFEATNAAELMVQVQERRWDVVVLDITLPDRSGLEVLKDIKAMYPELPVLILSMHPEDQYATRVLKAGAAGYINKQSAGEDLVRAIRKAAGGGRYVSPSLAEKLALEIGTDREKPPHERLSDREFQVMRLIASGKRLQEIAEKLSLSVKTISTYRGRVLGKMGMSSNAELTVYCMENDLLDE